MLTINYKTDTYKCSNANEGKWAYTIYFTVGVKVCVLSNSNPSSVMVLHFYVFFVLKYYLLKANTVVHVY